MAGFVQVIGWGTVIALTAKTAYNLGHFVYCLFIGPALGRQIDPRKYGPWAGNIPFRFPPSFFSPASSSFSVVTGATDGIGKAYASKLASFGLNIVLISRTRSKLDRVADEIRKMRIVCTKKDRHHFLSSLMPHRA